MNEPAKITANHLSRHAIVYLRQSSAAQVEHNRESTDRQYALATKARDLGWPDERIIVIDEDLGLSGSGVIARSGFARLTAEVALARVGLVLGLEVSRLARNNAEWYRLIDLAGLLHLGRCRRRGPLAPGRGRCLRHPQRLRTFCRDGLSTPRLAVVPFRRAQASAADECPCRDPLGRCELYRHPPRADQPRLCRRLHLWQNTPGDDPGCFRRAQDAYSTLATVR